MSLKKQQFKKIPANNKADTEGESVSVTVSLLSAGTFSRSAHSLYKLSVQCFTVLHNVFLNDLKEEVESTLITSADDRKPESCSSWKKYKLI